VLLALFATYVIWGSTYLAIRYMLVSFPPFLGIGLRFLAAGGVLYGFLRGRGVPNPSWSEWRDSAIVGAFLLAGGVGVTTFAEQWISSGLAAVSAAAIPIWSALFGGLWGQWPARREWIGIFVGFGGVALLAVEGSLSATNPVGVIAMQIAVVLWSFGSVWSRRLKLPQGTMGFATEMLTGGVLLLLIGLVAGERFTEFPQPSAIAAWVYLTIVGSLVAFSAYMYLLKTVQSALATSYAYVNPVIAVLLGTIIAGEHITGIGLVAMALIIAGLALIAWAGQRRKKVLSAGY
jgi:drug/metabolite transporter (DMT)-like permease